MLSHYVVSPREGHLQNKVFHLFAYLKHHKQSEMVFEDTEPVFDKNTFKVCDWSEFYPLAEEAIPHKNVQIMLAARPRGACIQVCSYL